LSTLDETTTEGDAPPQPWRFELWFAVGGLLVGLLVLPALIYLIGTLLLGPYSQPNGFLSFYGGLLADLARGQLRAWTLVLGPYLVSVTLRGIWLLRRGSPKGGNDEPRRREPSGEQRVEPKVSWD
jgi:hypothetical protein